MAVNMFLDLHGIPGGSINAEHLNQIDVLGWSWGMHNSANPRLGKGSGVGKVDVQDFQFVKPLDKASTALLENCAKCLHIDSAVISIFKGGGNRPIEYLTFRFEQVCITSVSMSLGSGEMELNENVSMSFRAYKVTMHPQTERGARAPAVECDFDIAKNA